MNQTTISVDAARILPRFRLEEQQARIFRSEFARATMSGITATSPRSFAPSPEDLRGIPIVGRGVGGVSPGTSPESATVRKITREEAAA